MGTWIDMNDISTDGVWTHTDNSDTSEVHGIMTGMKGKRTEKYEFLSRERFRGRELRCSLYAWRWSRRRQLLASTDTIVRCEKPMRVAAMQCAKTFFVKNFKNDF